MALRRQHGIQELYGANGGTARAWTSSPYRQRSHTQTSATKGIKARAYLSLNVVLAVLCRKTFIPTSPPTQPPSAPRAQMKPYSRLSSIEISLVPVHRIKANLITHGSQLPLSAPCSMNKGRR
jgi:hypothetical protein